MMLWKRRATVTEFCLWWSAFITGGHCLSFITEPQDHVVPLGNSAILFCDVNITSASEIQSIEWYRNQSGSIPPDAVNNVTRGDDRLEAALTFPTGIGYREFEGLYHCVVTTRNGRLIRSRDASITAKRITSLRMYGRNESSVVVSSIETVVVVQRGYFVESIPTVWNVVCLSNSSLQFGLRGLVGDFSQDRRLESQSLLLVSLYDLQLVTSTNCTTFVVESTIATSNQSVIIDFSDSQHFEPRLVVGPSDTTAVVGSNVTLNCIGNSVNTSYWWTKDGQMVDIEKEARLSNPTAGVLRIMNVSEEDSGAYNCTATIGSYLASSVGQLTVSAAPSVSLSVSRSAVTVDNLSYWNVTCDTLGSRPLLVSVLFNAGVHRQVTLETDSSSSVSYTLGLTGSGYIQCLVSNNFGSSQQGSYIDVVSQVSPTVHLPSEDASATTWTASTGCSTSFCRTPGTKQPTPDDSDGPIACLGMTTMAGVLAGYAVLLVVIVILVCMLCRQRMRNTHSKEVVNSKRSDESCMVHSNTAYTMDLSSPSSSLQRANKDADKDADRDRATGLLTGTDDASESTRNEVVYDVPIVSRKPALSQSTAGYQVPRSQSVNQELGQNHEYTIPSQLNKVADTPSTDSDYYVTMQPGL